MFNHTSQIYLLINEYKALHMVLYDLHSKYVIEITFVHNFKFFFQNSLYNRTCLKQYCLIQ